MWCKEEITPCECSLCRTDILHIYRHVSNGLAQCLASRGQPIIPLIENEIEIVADADIIVLRLNLKLTMSVTFTNFTRESGNFKEKNVEEGDGNVFSIFLRIMHYELRLTARHTTFRASVIRNP